MIKKNFWRLLNLIFIFFIFFVGFVVQAQQGGKGFSDALKIGPGYYESKDMVAGDEFFYYVELASGQGLEVIANLVPKGAGIGQVILYDEDKMMVAQKKELVEVSPKTFSLFFLAGSQKEIQKVFIRQYCDFFGLSNFSLTIRVNNYFDGKTSQDAGEEKNKAIQIGYGKTQGYLAGTDKAGNDRIDFYKISIQKVGDLYVSAKPLIEEGEIFLSVFDSDNNLVLKASGNYQKELKASRYITKLGDYFIKVEGKSEGILPYQIEILPKKTEGELPPPSLFQKINFKYIIGTILLFLVFYFFGKKIYRLLKIEKKY